jgi:FAD:protein FMN transferase
MILETKILKPKRGITSAYFRLFFLRLLILIGFVLISSCNHIKKDSYYLHLTGQAQGTTFSIVYSDTLMRDFSKSIDSLFRLIDKSMSLWDSNSVISKVNKNIENTVVDIHFANVFNRAVYYSEMTDGAFDMTVGSLARRWGFHFKKNEPPPDSGEVKKLLECVGWKKVKLSEGIVSKEKPCIQIDFNAIAQGYTVDVISDFLHAQSIQNYMVELGGEVRVSGLNESGHYWKIGIDKPVEESIHPSEHRPLQTVISLHSKALATSGSYRKHIVLDGKKLSHTINPLTGYPAQHHLLSVTVLSDRCMDADALATCCMVMGLDKSIEFALKYNLPIYCIYENENGFLQDRFIGNWTH